MLSMYNQWMGNLKVVVEGLRAVEASQYTIDVS